ncbi:hypothetical protein HDU76_000982 [Blyttiomyces sp. JEL0837]|nr:hypothetical protein HDU76_000982 [Blyttiomyces sp. JEL0837]
MAGQALRLLLPSIQLIHVSIVEATLSLLKSPHIQIQYEGYEMLKELVQRENLQDSILTQLIMVLKTPVDDVMDEINDERRRRNQKPTEGKTLTANQWGGMMVTEEKPSDAMLAAYIQQAYAAKLLGVIAASSAELAERMIQLQVVSGLLNTIANVSHQDSQRYASDTLLYLVQHFSYVAHALRDHMGKNFFDLLEGKPDTFFRELTWEQVRYLRKNTVRINATEDMDAEQTDDESVESGSSDENGSKSSTRPTSSKNRSNRASVTTTAFPPTSREYEPGTTLHDSKAAAGTEAVKTAKEPFKVDYEEVKEPNEEPIVQDLYVPYGHVSENATFSGNKFKAAKTDPKEQFGQELEQFRATNSKRIQKDKDEFHVHFDSTLQSKFQNMKEDPSLFSRHAGPAGDDVGRTSRVPQQPQVEHAGGIPQLTLAKATDDNTE